MAADKIKKTCHTRAAAVTHDTMSEMCSHDASQDLVRTNMSRVTCYITNCHVKHSDQTPTLVIMSSWPD